MLARNRFVEARRCVHEAPTFERRSIEWPMSPVDGEVAIGEQPSTDSSNSPEHPWCAGWELSDAVEQFRRSDMVVALQQLAGRGFALDLRGVGRVSHQLEHGPVGLEEDLGLAALRERFRSVIEGRSACRFVRPSVEKRSAGATTIDVACDHRHGDGSPRHDTRARRRLA